MKRLFMIRKHIMTTAVGLFCLMFITQSAYCWWDQYLVVGGPVPLMKEIEAETCPGVEKTAIVDDPQADGGRGGKSVLLTPGRAGLTTEIEVEPGIYAIFMIARNQADKIGLDLMTLEVKERKTGQVKSWTMPVAYREQYFAVGQMYFPAHAGGKYTVMVSLALKAPSIKVGGSALNIGNARTLLPFFDPANHTLMNPLEPLIVDRLELRDALGNCIKKAIKKKRMLTSDADLAAIRREFSEQYAKGKVDLRDRDYDVRTAHPEARTPEQRRARNDELWGRAPNFNELVGYQGHDQETYGWLLGHDSSGVVAASGALYEKTGDKEIGWDGGVTLCALAEKFPAFDGFVQHVQANLMISKIPFTFSIIPRGKMYTANISRVAIAYDRLFDFIKDNQALADYVGSKIAWVKTPKDVITFLDTNLLQAAFDASCRDGGGADKAIIPLIQGVCEESDWMLDHGAFYAYEGQPFYRKFTYLGGVDDVAFADIRRDRFGFEDVANYLHRYHLAGGSVRYDILETQPDLFRRDEDIVRSYEQTHLSGGFMAGITWDFRGECRSAFKPHGPGRDPAEMKVSAKAIGQAFNVGHGGQIVVTKSWPSRLVPEHGLAILESGQFQEDVLKMRGAWVNYGLVGFPLQATSHGCLSLIDLGYYYFQGIKRHSPIGSVATWEETMFVPYRRTHNVVEVDSMRNVFGVKTYPGGVNTSLAPMSGAHFMEHSTPANTMPNISMYIRQTSLVDVENDESYLFDVVRVRGGKTHTYSLTAFPGRFESNVTMSPLFANDPGVNYTNNPAGLNECLHNYRDGMQGEGPNPTVLQADWVMDPDLQKFYQGKQYQADLVVTTRLSLMGREKDLAMVGHWHSDWYKYDFWNLYVQGKQEGEGRESVYPAIMETFAGKPFLGEKRQVSVSPEQEGAEAAVGMEVKTLAGRTDLLYSSVNPFKQATLDGKVKVSGKFAMVSRDAQGFRQMALVGGRELSGEEILLQLDRMGYESKIVDANYDESSFTVEDPLPSKLIKGECVNLDVKGKIHSLRLLELKAEEGKTRIRHDKMMKLYQSPIGKVDEQEGSVEVEIEPVNVAAGAVVSNEKQDTFWKVKSVEQGDRCMHMRFPGYRGSFMNRIALEDFPDMNKDGRRMVKLYGKKGQLDAQKNSVEGKLLLELEVTGVDKEGETFYFTLPKEKDYQYGDRGWNYVGLPMKNEDGTREWRATFPGSSFRIVLEGAVRKEDFTDANGDGKIKLGAYLFGPGDRLKQLDSHVNVERLAPGEYRVESNVGCTVGLPKGEYTRAEISADGVKFGPIASQIEGPKRIIKLSETDLADGKVILKLVKG